MAPIVLKKILSYTSEDPHHPVENLLKSDSYLKWKCSNDTNSQQSVIIQFDQLHNILSIDIGNECSATVGVSVAREDTDFKVLLADSSFMSPIESRNKDTPNRVRMFGKEKLNQTLLSEKWDRIKITCSQPFNKNTQYGLSFIRLHSDKENNSSPKEISLGAFTLKEESDEDVPKMSVFAAMNKKKQEINDKGKSDVNAPDSGFYQLKKEKPDTGECKKRPANTSYDDHRKKAKISAEESGNSSKEKRRDKEKKTHRNRDHHSHDDKRDSSKADTCGKKKISEDRDKRQSETKSKIDIPSTKNSRPFEKLMTDVSFVMSGYENPLRSELRDKLAKMGARYQRDWSKSSTHLICAFRGTPKYKAVQGKGKIVTEKWIEDCYKKKIRLPWRRYNLEKNSGADESEEEIWADELLPTSTAKETEKLEESDDDRPSYSDEENTDDEIRRAVKPKEKKTVDKIQNSPSYDDETDIDEENQKKDTSKLEMPVLANFFEGITFFLHRDLPDSLCESIQRYIIAHGGKISDYMFEDVSNVIANCSWNSDFDEAVSSNPDLHFIKPDWIRACCDQQILVSQEPYLILNA